MRKLKPGPLASLTPNQAKTLQALIGRLRMRDQHEIDTLTAKVRELETIALDRFNALRDQIELQRLLEAATIEAETASAEVLQLAAKLARLKARNKRRRR